jgi:hypothetical protein
MAWQTDIVSAGDFFNTQPEHNPFFSGGQTMPSTTSSENGFWESISTSASDFISGVGRVATSGLNAFGSVAQAAEANDPGANNQISPATILLAGGGILALILLTR